MIAVTTANQQTPPPRVKECRKGFQYLDRYMTQRCSARQSPTSTHRHTGTSAAIRDRACTLLYNSTHMYTFDWKVAHFLAMWVSSLAALSSSSITATGFTSVGSTLGRSTSMMYVTGDPTCRNKQQHHHAHKTEIICTSVYVLFPALPSKMHKKFKTRTHMLMDLQRPHLKRGAAAAAAA